MEKTNSLICDVLCEQQVLGVLMSCPDAFYQASGILSESLFFEPKNRAIYEAISHVVADGNTPDVIAVAGHLSKYPPKCVNITIPYLAECTSSVQTSVTFAQNIERLADLRKRRQMYLLGEKLKQAGTTELGETETISYQVINDLQTLDDAPNLSFKSNREAIKQLEEIVRNNYNGTRRNGIPTGFAYLDEKGGLQLTDLVIIAAEFSQGKTSLALDLCVNAARNGVPAAFFSTEMQCPQLAARMLAAESGISSSNIMYRPLTNEQLAKYDAAIREVEDLPIYFDDESTLSLERIISSIRSMNRKKGVKIAFVDYIQVLQTNEREIQMNEEKFLAFVTRKLKNLAKELNICIVALSQISRSKDGSTEPTLGRIRGSGQISEAADVMLLIYRPEFYGKRYSGNYCSVSTKGTALIKLAKGRNIGTGEFICAYDSATTHFYELGEIPYDASQRANDLERPFG